MDHVSLGLGWEGDWKEVLGRVAMVDKEDDDHSNKRGNDQPLQILKNELVEPEKRKVTGLQKRVDKMLKPV